MKYSRSLFVLENLSTIFKTHLYGDPRLEQHRELKPNREQHRDKKQRDENGERQMGDADREHIRLLEQRDNERSFSMMQHRYLLQFGG